MKRGSKEKFFHITWTYTKRNIEKTVIQSLPSVTTKKFCI